MRIKDIDWELNGVMFLVCFIGMALIFAGMVLAYGFILWDWNAFVIEIQTEFWYIFRAWLVFSLGFFAYMKINDL